MQNRNTKQQETARRTRALGCVVALGMALTIALPRVVYADTVTVPPVPDNIRVPAGNVAFLVGHAVGTQNYICVPADSIGHVAFALFTPEATLFGEQRDQLITHFFSPNPAEGVIVRATWQDSEDTSIVWARATASSLDPNFVAAGAIPWVLLQAVGTQVGPTGGETLAGTTFVQRLSTIGGAAPSTGCDLPIDIGRKAFVPYTADYFFYKKQ